VKRQLAIEGKTRGFDPAEVCQWKRCPDQIRCQRPIGVAVGYGAGDNSGASGFFRSGAEESEARRSKGALRRAGRQLAAEAIEGDGIDSRIRHIHQARQGRLGAGSVSVETGRSTNPEIGYFFPASCLQDSRGTFSRFSSLTH